jgi:hypothetical protein
MEREYTLFSGVRCQFCGGAMWRHVMLTEPPRVVEQFDLWGCSRPELHRQLVTV